MNDIIKLNCRSNEHHYLKKMSRPDNLESKTYVLKLSDPFVRGGYDDDGHKFIDSSGGPMIIENSRLEEADAVVKSIDFIMGYGYTITFY